MTDPRFVFFASVLYRFIQFFFHFFVFFLVVWSYFYFNSCVYVFVRIYIIIFVVVVEWFVRLLNQWNFMDRHTHTHTENTHRIKERDSVIKWERVRNSIKEKKREYETNIYIFFLSCYFFSINLLLIRFPFLSFYFDSFRFDFNFFFSSFFRIVSILDLIFNNTWIFCGSILFIFQICFDLFSNFVRWNGKNFVFFFDLVW